jgi:diguanylate cyclase (GGDEF)-like protein
MNAMPCAPVSQALRVLTLLRNRIWCVSGPAMPEQHLLRRTRRTAARHWAYLLALAPAVTDWLETRHLPTAPASYITELVIGGIIAACIAVIHRDMDRLDAMAHTDALTGLPNRRSFTADLEHEVALVQRLGIALTLVFVDINDFKRINDRHGHDVGDAVLRSVARLIQHRTRRAADKCYRIGGDEFVILLPGIDAGHAMAMMHGCRGHEETHYPLLSRHGVSLSCGAAQLRPSESCAEFMRRADVMMYDAKRRAQQRDSDA